LPKSLSPVYSVSAGISQAAIRKAVLGALDHPSMQTVLAEILPPSILVSAEKAAMQFSLRDAVMYLHQPPADADTNALMERTHPAWRRVKLEELLAQQISLKQAHEIRKGRASPPSILTDQPARSLSPVKTKSLTHQLHEALPFELTTAQNKVWAQISNDLQASFPMNRLLQGDVGSGKTIVAALASAQMVERSYQVAIMAPTEILAEQHYLKFKEWFEPLGVSVIWLAGGMKAKEKKQAQDLIESGQAQIVVGTHALIQDAVHFAALGLAVID